MTAHVAQLAHEGGKRQRLGGLALVLSVSLSWVCVAQLARLAEKRTELAHHCSIVPLMTCANVALWMALSVPHALRKAYEFRETGVVKVRASSPDLWRTDAFDRWQPPRFLALALATNFCYMSALHYLPASLNTAIFCTNPIFTFLLSASWLPADIGATSSSKACAKCAAALFSRSGAHVLLSVAGVVLIVEPWDRAGNPHYRGVGVALSLLAALGTATYQVYFKVTFGDRLRPDEVGLFLAHMGAAGAMFLSLVLAVLMSTGVYKVDLSSVPWHLVCATAVASALFNFLIKFGISVDSPLAMSLATQIGIPLNLILDVAVVRANIDPTQALGTLAMLASFTLQQRNSAAHARERYFDEALLKG
mmetsp:Transcript_113743/g.317689  ORF Transcript_113743/g.317689 Transcript_113743/m.317689 type:complete len:364 (-) Transcript_113743:49-1140(-)|eukprot:CAMPEP_0176263444 /NCGR_PEP_ID=MMETSP0121_2-20121125/41127_1 /TAXON_ID=160619 /ORGANISM="Kryptoperidinium foliaceum, Strain CCMP 1326" /LENGTH=363 /DNA_ID=CAMNT_0017603437 /DNA_START=1 /DNA_END=1092 /DNA_ORIENTATION=+